MYRTGGRLKGIRSPGRQSLIVVIGLGNRLRASALLSVLPVSIRHNVSGASRFAVSRFKGFIFDNIPFPFHILLEQQVETDSKGNNYNS